MKPKAVIFDIDNTLYSYDAAHAIAFSALTEYAGRVLDLTASQFEALHSRGNVLLKAHSGGHCAAIHNRLIRYQLMLEDIGAPLRYAPKMSELYWQTLIDAINPFPGVVDAFHRLKSMGLKIGIGTNMTADHQFTKLNKLELLDLVDFMVSSEEVSAEKPDRRLFDLCARKACSAPEECVFVGDSLEGDVLGATHAGMRAVWFHPDGGTIKGPDDAVRLESMFDLPELLAVMS